MVSKTREHSYGIRETVIKHFLNGDSEHGIASKVLLSRNSVHYIIAKYKKTKCIGNILGRGRKRMTTEHLDRLIQRKVKADRRKSAASVKVEVENELGIKVSEQTVRRRLHEVGLYGRVARKKPYVSKVNRGKRLRYVKSWQEKPLECWKNVLWSDETKFNLFGSDGKVMVWRSPKEEFYPSCTVPTVKHGDGNVKCWGCMSSCGLGNLVFIDENMTGLMYREILAHNLLESVRKLRLNKDWVFQHDNDPKHRARVVTKWLDENSVKQIERPSFSPDLNPIEHLWDEMERRMKKESPKNERELKEAVLRVWQGIGSDVTKKLVDSIPNRLYEVIRMKGFPTKY